jgi:hypothetical protein
MISLIIATILYIKNDGHFLIHVPLGILELIIELQLLFGV